MKHDKNAIVAIKKVSSIFTQKMLTQYDINTLRAMKRQLASWHKEVDYYLDTKSQQLLSGLAVDKVKMVRNDIKVNVIKKEAKSPATVDTNSSLDK